MNRILRTTAKIILLALSLTVILITGVLIAVNLSPKPFAWYVRQQFSGGVGVRPVMPANYRELSQKVRIEKDIEYPSRFKDNRLDVFGPKDGTGPLPTILWTHGGGFVGGDKAGIETWATMIAAKGYTVVSIKLRAGLGQPLPGSRHSGW
jgi:acetyl esterase/lipase